ncbi:reticulocyte-binding 2 a [Fusarium heterosporum]|uniref:Reticulocyte-binding 2 a n=1 Tax=Fusarium heterosporum TaxID=42747 RepID=A0A8H5TIQ4_FUSHE|nr:reticulocyte-binding 2 a [Fusarium heterosporum]
MNVTLWDPASLLQITDGARDGCGKVNCIGNAKYNVRCRWDVVEPNRSSVRALLIQMSKSLPESVTTNTLRQLARLCLCPDFHSHQAETFVSNWRKVINITVQHRANLVQVQTAKYLSQITLKTEELADLETSLAVQRQSYAELQNQNETLAADLEGQIEELNQELQKRKDECAASMLMCRQLKLSHEAGAEQVLEESFIRKKAEEDNDILLAKLKALDMRLKDFVSVREENEKMKEQLETLTQESTKARDAAHRELEKAKAVANQSADERATFESVTRRYQIQLEEQKAHCTILKGQVEDLETTVAELQTDIRRCWPHRIWARIAKFGRGNVPKSAVTGKNDTTEVRALKTYA